MVQVRPWRFGFSFYLVKNRLGILEVRTCSSSIDHLGSSDNMLRISSYFDIEIDVGLYKSVHAAV